MTGYVLDDTLLRALAQGDDDVANLIASLDARNVRMAVPVNTLLMAQAGLSDEQSEYLNAVVERVPHIRLDDLTELDHISAIARVEAWIREPEDIAAAHALALAKLLDCPILTLDLQRWKRPQTAVPWQVRLIEYRQE
ncbi:hypothetical protein [Nocardia crassostreae]|uniref:hypothetical protein n=1 Tax=Nocardia crassostreae TaxID=53428 RepID=UPI000830BA72|nr:hypothetical protein [Nocardia crassostreae]